MGDTAYVLRPWDKAPEFEGGHPAQHVVMLKFSLASFHCVPLHSVAINSCEETPNDFVISISHNHSGQIITVENMF